MGRLRAAWERAEGCEKCSHAWCDKLLVLCDLCCLYPMQWAVYLPAHGQGYLAARKLPNHYFAHGSRIFNISALISPWPGFDLCMGLQVQGQVHVAVRKLLAAYPDEVGSITTTGHSLGGALASLCAFDLVCSFLLRLSHDGLASQWKGIPYAHMVSAMHRDGLLRGADPNMPGHLNIQTHGTGGARVC